MNAFYSINNEYIYVTQPSEKVNWDLVRRMTVYPRFYTVEDGLLCSTDITASFAVPACTAAFGVNGIRKFVRKHFPNAKIVFDFSEMEEGIDITPNRGRVSGKTIEFLRTVKTHNGVWGIGAGDIGLEK